jgi:DNA repair exonuclease SbcCD ATPase subunit
MTVRLPLSFFNSIVLCNRLSNIFIMKGDQTAALQKALTENSKLKEELELLSDQRNQNQALKEHVLNLVTTCDEQRAQLALLTKQLQNAKNASLSPEEQTELDNSISAQISSFESIISKLREDNSSLENSIQKIKDELNELKKKKTETPAAANAAASTATATSGLSRWTAWTTKTASTTTPAPSASTNSEVTKLEEQLKSAQHEIEKLKQDLESRKSEVVKLSSFTENDASSSSDQALKLENDTLKAERDLHIQQIKDGKDAISRLQTQMESIFSSHVPKVDLTDMQAQYADLQSKLTQQGDLII